MKFSKEECYNILGISSGSSSAEINAAYRKKIKYYHPDSDTGNAEEFKKVKYAYDKITGKIDDEGYGYSGNSNHSYKSNSSDYNSFFGNSQNNTTDSFFSSFTTSNSGNSSFESFFNAFTKLDFNFNKPTRLENINNTIDVNISDLANAKTLKYEYLYSIICDCNNGCRKCKNRGYTKKKTSISFQLEPEKTKYKFLNKGNVFKNESSNLILTIQLVKSPKLQNNYFRINKLDLYEDLSVPIISYLFSKPIYHNDIYNENFNFICKITNNKESVFTVIRNRGMYNKSRTRRGDLYIKINTIITSQCIKEIEKLKK